MKKLIKICCIDCGSENTQEPYPGVGKCLICGAYFDIEELPVRVEKIKKLPKDEDDDIE